MSTTYSFKISSPFTYVKAILLSLTVPLVYVIVVCIAFSATTLEHSSNLFFFIGGGLWFISFAIAIYTSGEKMECEIGEDTLIIRKKNAHGFPAPEILEMNWDRLRGYSVHQDGNGILLILSFKDFTKRQWITIPFINNDSSEIRSFLADFQKYAARYNAQQTAPREKIKRGKTFSETRIARIIGYFVIVYLLFITTVKVFGYDQGKIPWSNIGSTYFFATMYLMFVFWRKKGSQW
mgnify:CR=1 FL=1